MTIRYQYDKITNVLDVYPGASISLDAMENFFHDMARMFQLVLESCTPVVIVRSGDEIAPAVISLQAGTPANPMH